MLYFNDHNEKTSTLVNEDLATISSLTGFSESKIQELASELDSSYDQAVNSLTDGSEWEFTYEDAPIYS